MSSLKVSALIGKKEEPGIYNKDIALCIDAADDIVKGYRITAAGVTS